MDNKIKLVKDNRAKLLLITDINWSWITNLNSHRQQTKLLKDDRDKLSWITKLNWSKITELNCY